MIKVQTKLLRTTSKIKDVSSILFNQMAEDVAKHTEKEVKNFKCEHHPQQTSTLVVVAEKKGVRFDKSGFCCKEFADMVQLKG